MKYYIMLPLYKYVIIKTYVYMRILTWARPDKNM